jgi:hypothetical protein
VPAGEFYFAKEPLFAFHPISDTPVSGSGSMYHIRCI